MKTHTKIYAINKCTRRHSVVVIFISFASDLSTVLLLNSTAQGRPETRWRGFNYTERERERDRGGVRVKEGLKEDTEEKMWKNKID